MVGQTGPIRDGQDYRPTDTLTSTTSLAGEQATLQEAGEVRVPR